MTDRRIRIDADLLIPGRGAPRLDASVVIDCNEIIYVGSSWDAPQAPQTVHVPVLVPGFWDAHVHYTGLATANLEELLTTPSPILVARATRDLGAALNAGITSVRELGGYGAVLRRVVDEGSVRGPSIWGAGRALTMSGGHGDIHSLPYEIVEKLGEDVPFATMVDGRKECTKAVRRQIRDGARVIKVHATGGVMSELDQPQHQQLSESELRAVVEEAGRAEIAVAAHCHGNAGIRAALRAGVRTIEHGTYLDDESIQMMLDRNAILVPTRASIAALVPQRETLPVYAYDRIRALADRHLESLRKAIEADVLIATGSDIFATGAGHGKATVEVRHLIEAGMRPLRAIEAATVNGALTLGPRAPKVGRIAVGWEADLVAMARSPLEDITVWGDPDVVTHVWKAGYPVKRPLVEPVVEPTAAAQGRPTERVVEEIGAILEGRPATTASEPTLGSGADSVPGAVPADADESAA